MAKAYVSMREDKFSRAIVDAKRPVGGGLSNNITNATSNTHAVRRPLNGMHLPKDSYASMTVVSPSGKLRDVLYNTSSIEEAGNEDNLKSSYTTNFIVQNVTESKSEKQQIVQTFGDDFVYFYGQQPITLQVQAVLPESPEFQYAQEFWINYANALRGTRLVLKDARLYFTVAGQVFEGYMTSASTTKNAQNPRIINLSFNMYVTNSYFVRALVKRLPGGLGLYQDTRQGDYISYTGYDKEDAKANTGDETQGELTGIAFALDRIGFGKYVDGLQDTLSGSFERTVPFPTPAEVTFPYEASSTNGAITLNTGKPLVQALKTGTTEDKFTFNDFKEGVSTTLAFIAGGFVVAGVVKSVYDLFNETSLEEAGAYIQNQFNEVVDSTVDSIDNAATGLFNSGYSLVQPNKVGAVTEKSKKADAENIDSQVLDI
jgi:hypothetical protein